MLTDQRLAHKTRYFGGLAVAATAAGDDDDIEHGASSEMDDARHASAAGGRAIAQKSDRNYRRSLASTFAPAFLTVLAAYGRVRALRQLPSFLDMRTGQ